MESMNYSTAANRKSSKRKKREDRNIKSSIKNHKTVGYLLSLLYYGIWLQSMLKSIAAISYLRAERDCFLLEGNYLVNVRC